MNREKVSLAQLNRYQIAGLAMGASTIVALAVLYVLRRMGLVSAPAGKTQETASEPPEAQPSVSTRSQAETPTHFSEDLLVPGFIHTGNEIAEQDRENGHSSEGV